MARSGRSRRRRNNRVRNSYVTRTRPLNRSRRSLRFNTTVNYNQRSRDNRTGIPFKALKRRSKSFKYQKRKTTYKSVNNRLNTIPRPVYLQLMSDTKFAARYEICKRRQQRREIMHATRRAGQGGQRSRKLTGFFNIRC